jgi:hypothetical protein
MIKHIPINASCTPGYQDNPSVDDIGAILTETLRGMNSSTPAGDLRIRRIAYLAHLAKKGVPGQVPPPPPMNEEKDVVTTTPVMDRPLKSPRLAKTAMRSDIVKMCEAMHSLRLESAKIVTAVSNLSGLQTGDRIAKILNDTFNNLQYDQGLEALIWVADPSYRGYPIQNDKDLERFKEEGGI